MNIVAIIGILIGLGIMAPSLFKKIKGNTYTYGVNATYLGFDVEEEDENGLSKRISLKFRYKLFEKEYEVKCKKTYILSVTQFEAFFNKNGLVENGNKFIYVNPMKPSECSLVGGSAQSPLPIYIGGALIVICLIGGVVSPIIKRANENKVEDSAVLENTDVMDSEDISDNSIGDNSDSSLSKAENDSETDKNDKEVKRPATDTVMGIIAFAGSYTDSPKRDTKQEEVKKSGNDGIVKDNAYKTPSETTISKSFLEEYLSVSENSIEGVNANDTYAGYSVFREEMKRVLEGESSYLVEGKDYSVAFTDAKSDGTSKSMGSVRRDLNQDGIDELLVGEGKSDQSIIYDIYTIGEDRVQHLISGDKEHKIYLCKNGLIAVQTSISETEYSIAYMYFHKNNFYIHKVLFYDESKPEKSRWSLATDSISDKSNAVDISDDQAKMILERYKYKQISFGGFID